ncbi:DUF4374 domain-containing protein [Echinicola rosea]|uniref:DUF4374 domain-containing protein n=1 Tax=Echinicola rosea TaxID=1807691 RepID=A0ABQ1V5L9_9BACT|nr:DUF4374 domain-containing protein [Echinicola rosea]GGF40110.1 hypothetical protein GCM10011339_30800 [Echinicola rosea]
MRTRLNNWLGAGALAAFTLMGCTNDDGPDGPGNVSERFVIASTPTTASDGVADYLLTAESLTSGTISTVGNGIEQDGTYRYYITINNKFFSLLYGQGNPGAVTTYQLNNQGQLAKLSDFQAETVQAFAEIDDDLLMMKIPRSGAEDATWYQMDTDMLQITGDGLTNIVDVANNGERAHFTWLTQVGDKVYAPYMSIKGCCDDNFGTNNPDSAWVAVYDYPSMELEKVIKDDRTSYIGRYFTEGLTEVENGDVYAFSSGVATNNGEASSTLPSAFVRIKAGQTEFDQSYYFNIEEVADGYHVTDKTYLGDGKFVVNMHNEKGAYTTGSRLAIVNVYDESFTWVTGTPDPENVLRVTTNNYSLMDGNTAYIGFTTEQGSWVYEVDATSATATQGLKVEGGTITAISKLDVAE